MRHALATVRWTPSKDGGRREPLVARRYMAPVAFGDDGPEWTLVVDRAAAEPRDAEAVLVHFLMEDAPHESLVTGARFRLHEGPRVVAEGEITEVFDLNPAAWLGGMAA